MPQSYKVHLAKDPVLKQLLLNYSLTPLNKSTNLYLSLVEIIISQQLSIKAADTIFNRLLALTGKSKDKVIPQDLFNLPLEKLRSAGLSNAKASYVHSLSESILNKTFNLESLNALSDENVKTELIKLKGIGPWSAEMFLIFDLGRPDIFSIGDLGLRTAVSKLYSIDRNNLAQILKLSENWSPYRSYASRLLWKSLDDKN